MAERIFSTTLGRCAGVAVVSAVISALASASIRVAISGNRDNCTAPPTVGWCDLVASRSRFASANQCANFWVVAEPASLSLLNTGGYDSPAVKKL